MQAAICTASTLCTLFHNPPWRRTNDLYILVHRPDRFFRVLRRSLSLSDFICKLVKIRVADYRSCGRIQRRIRYVTKFKHRDKHRCFDARNINCMMRHTSWPLRSLCHALSSLSSQLIPIGSLQRENRLATIDGYLSISLSFSPSSSLLPFGSLPRSSRNSSFSLHFLQLGTEGEREGKKKLLISKDIKYPPP